VTTSAALPEFGFLRHTEGLRTHFISRDVERTVDLEEAFGAHAARIFNYFRKMGVPREGAADLAQDTFLRAIRSAARYRGDAPVEVWLLGIARNVFREWLRRRREVPLPEGAAAAAGSEASNRVEVSSVLGGLDPDHREVLVLRFVLDLSGEEVARVLGISHDAVRQRVARAKAEFRRAWDP